MARRVSPFAAVAALLLTLAGCSNYEARRPAWRTEAEDSCLAQNLVQPSAYIEPEDAIDGPGICGLTHPFKISALLDGQVSFDRRYTLDCPMIAALDNWVRENVEPEAQARFGERVTEIESFGTYSCRGINGEAGARLSEHAFGNAIDVSGFRLADGREISVMRDWPGSDPQASAFLHDIHAGACNYFTTVLGPGYNFLHYNHFHLDLAMHGNTSTGPRRVCRPEPQALPQDHPPDGLPEPPPVDEEMDISQAGSGDMQALALHAGPDAPDAAVPQAAYSTRPQNDPAPVPSQSVPREGTIRADGAFVPEGRPQDWDLPPPR
ncbi:MAG TPA: extensin family protein [Methylovirgula sp.]|nr:extensin family protein [Methylovirgula sp.]